MELINMKVMFVCTANTCRSAMAEAIFKTMVDEGIEVYSAGTHALTGSHASENTLYVCGCYGLDLSEHTATNIVDSDILDMDLVLTATLEHREFLKKKYGDKLNEVYTIKEYAGLNPMDIADPFGYDVPSYDVCFKEIYSTLEKIDL